MHVVATAGHVDHGKSTLVRALTGMEPDRWAEEVRRGMTIDLGFAWTTLPGGEVLGFVDVPGHQRFLGNMLAGLGPAPAVLFVVAADEGWGRQSAEHLAAIDGLGLTHGLLAVTRSDLADHGPATAQALAALEKSSLGVVPAVAVSGMTGAGLAELREALTALVAGLPSPDATGPVRLWVDRSFTIRGAGTVVTGTLAAGTLAVGDALQLGERTVRVRGLQSLGAAADRVSASARVAVNLRGVDRSEVGRGDVLLTGTWHLSGCVDVRLSTLERLPEQQVLHVGTAAVPVRVRHLADGTARLHLPAEMPLRAGDRALLRDPAGQRIAAGVTVLDADPPPLRRRGAAALRAEVLAAGAADLTAEVERRGVVARSALAALGLERSSHAVHEVGDWLVSRETWARWLQALPAAVDAHAAANPLGAGLPAASACQALGLPSQDLVAPLVLASGLEELRGRVRRPGTVPDLGAAEQSAALVEQRLRADPFDAPGSVELQAIGLGPRQLAAAVTAGRLLVHDGVALLPTAPDQALRLLVDVPSPFTVAQAREALGARRSVAVAVLEQLDARGDTVRLAGGVRRLTAAGLSTAAALVQETANAPAAPSPPVS